MEEVYNNNILFNDDELFVYPSILSGEDKMMIVSNTLLGNESIQPSCRKYNTESR